MFKINKILEDIYKKIFLRERDYTINIFLCGAKLMEKNTIRSLIYEEIKDNSIYNVIFPEWLFSKLLEFKDELPETLIHQFIDDMTEKYRNYRKISLDSDYDNKKF